MADFELLESRRLFADVGLTAAYFKTPDLSGPAVTGTARTVDFDFGTATPGDGFAADNWSARYTGQIKPTFSENTSFKIVADDGVRLWVDHTLLIDTWTTRGEKTSTGTIQLTVGKRAAVQLEYRDLAGVAKVKLLWSSASIAEQVVSSKRFVPRVQQLEDRIDHAFSFAKTQLARSVAELNGSTTAFPEITAANGTWQTRTVDDWTAGFFGGALWQVNRHFVTKADRELATKYTTPLAPEKSAGDDLGFRFVPTYLNLYRAMGKKQDRLILRDAAASKVANFDTKVGMFRSVNFKPTESNNPNANFPVLMDHTMDLELVYEAAKMAGRPDWAQLANKHLEKLSKTMVRSDGSTVQWGYFNEATGAFVSAETRQGISGTSTWSRGQAWGIYSFVTAYKHTGRADFLATAKKMINYWLAKAPAGTVPLWDFDAPATATTPRDSSAAAIFSSALFDLASLTRGTTDGAKYRAAALATLDTLLGPSYLAEGTSSRGLLLHGARHVKQGVSDNSLIYGDYYTLEAMNRWRTLQFA